MRVCDASREKRRVGNFPPINLHSEILILHSFPIVHVERFLFEILIETIFAVFAAGSAELVSVMETLVLLAVAAVNVDFAAFQLVGQAQNILHLLGAYHRGQGRDYDGS